MVERGIPAGTGRAVRDEPPRPSGSPRRARGRGPAATDRRAFDSRGARRRAPIYDYELLAESGTVIEAGTASVNATARPYPFIDLVSPTAGQSASTTSSRTKCGSRSRLRHRSGRSISAARACTARLAKPRFQGFQGVPTCSRGFVLQRFQAFDAHWNLGPHSERNLWNPLEPMEPLELMLVMSSGSSSRRANRKAGHD